jgi:hypothetical protein
MPLTSMSLTTGARIRTFAAFILLAFPGLAAHAQWTISDVIENVRACELLYERLEVRHEEKYQLFGTQAPETAAASYQDEGRTDFQSGLFYLQHSRRQIPRSSQKEQLVETRQAYDGEKTRMLQRNTYANIHLGRVEDKRLFRPHLLLLSSLPGRGQLSRRMTVKEDSDNVLVWSTEGEEGRRSLRCVLVRVEWWGRGEAKGKEPAAVCRVWLAVDRNYLPIEVHAIGRGFTEPYSIGTIDEFREISPGLWFPIKAKTSTYDMTKRVDGRRVEYSRWETTVTHVDPSPQYEKEFFQNVEFPPGVPIYTVRDGEIIATELSRPPGTGLSNQLVWFLIVSVILVVLAAIVVLRARSRRNAAKAAVAG